MNKLILCIFLITCLGSMATAQDKKFLLGFEGWGSLTQSETTKGNRYITGANTRVYAGKFITKSIVLYAFFENDYFGNRFTGEVEHQTKGKGTSNIRDYSTTPQLGLGIRKYYSFTAANKVGLLLDAEGDYGIRVRRLKYRSKFGDEETKIQTTENLSEASLAINTGAYYNLNTNWQFIFKIGGAYFHYLWDDEEVKRIGSTTLPQKGLRAGLGFNSESFRLSFVRLL